MCGIFSKICRKSDWSGLNETLRTFRYLMDARKRIDLRAEGYSMYPYIRPGDICRFVPPRHPLRKGQVVLVVSPRGILVSHRLIACKTENGQPVYIFRGDMNPHPDQPASPQQVVGVLEALVRNGKVVDEQRRGRKVWAWIMVRFRLVFRAIGYLMLMADADREILEKHRRRIYGFRNPEGLQDGSPGAGLRSSNAGRRKCGAGSGT